MFIILVTYKQPLEVIDRHLAAHRAFLDSRFAVGELLCTGPQNPRTGGVIISRVASRAEVEAFIAEDPFRKNDVADYAITEFEPNKWSEAFGGCI